MFNNLLELRNTPNQRPGEKVEQVTVGADAGHAARSLRGVGSTGTMQS